MFTAYHMEKPSEPGVPVPLDLKLVNFNSLDFNLVFEEGEYFCLLLFMYLPFFVWKLLK